MMRRGNIFWGIVLVLLGTLFLLDNLGYFPGFNVWPVFWACFLILLGARMIYLTLNRPKFELEHVRVPLEGAEQAELTLNHGAGELRLAAAALADDVVEGDFSGGVRVHTQRNGNTLNVSLSVPTSNVPFDVRPQGLNWDVRLNRQVHYGRLELNTGANSSDINLSELRVAQVRLQTGASSSLLHLPEHGQTQVRVEAGAASVSLVVPPGVAGRIHGSGGLYTLSVDTQRFPKTGGVYLSPDYETAADRVEIEITTGVGSVDVR